MSRRAARPAAVRAGFGPCTFALVDTHCHLDHMANADELVADAAKRSLGICCATVTPAEARAARARFCRADNVCVGTGLHPWWIADGSCTGEDVDRLVLDVRRACFVAEVGLDFGPRHASSHAAQEAAFDAIVRTCAEHPLPGRVLSIHAVRAADTALDVLERYDLPHQASCIFHWFSGTSEDLARARQLGCYFSINEYMLNSKRGREYARIVPAERLLLETDQPDVFDEAYSLEAWLNSLAGTTNRLAMLRSCEEEGLACQMAQTSNRIFAACFAQGRST